LAALCPSWFHTTGAEGDIIQLIHAFHTSEMTLSSFKVLHQILSITTFPDPPSELAKDLETIQKRLQWTAGDFEKSLVSAVSYFQEMFQWQVSYGMEAILAVKHQVRSMEPLKLFATLLRGLKYLQEYQISIPSEGPELLSESSRTRSSYIPSASICESVSDTDSIFSTSHEEHLLIPLSPNLTTFCPTLFEQQLLNKCSWEGCEKVERPMFNVFLR
jgi:hypothetical protein